VVQIVLGADAAADNVIVNGTAGPDRIDVGVTGARVDVKGLVAETRISQSTTADRLTVNGLVGNDSLKAAGGTEGTIAITLNGNEGDDFLSADAILNGGAGNDVLVSGPGDDTINGGAGYDTVQATGDVNFVLTNTSLTGIGATGTDTLADIERAELTGGFGDNVFNIGGFTGDVALAGLHGSDTVDFSGSDSA